MDLIPFNSFRTKGFERQMRGAFLEVTDGGAVSVSQVLVLGCGNSELSEQLYDVGYKHLTNIDISETVVTHMNQRNAARRPGLSFHRVDATQTLYEDASFQVSLDKGTLDAMAAEEGGALARRMLQEVRNRLL